MSWSVADFNPTEDWSLWDGVETVTYYHYDETDDSYSEPGDSVQALCRFLGYTTVTLANGETTSVDLVFHVPQSSLSASPRRFDKIIRTETDGKNSQTYDRVYIVQTVERSTLGTRYKLQCNRQQIDES